MMRSIALLVVFTSFATTKGQTDTNTYLNTAERLLAKNARFTIGGYGEVHYNQPLNSDIRQNGKLDVHRFILLFGYRFNDRVQFISEIEFEHVNEVYIEQFFLQYKINRYLNIRGGLLLIPMGIINEYHEPTTFNGVERPFIDTYIAPTTWREIGFGFTGNIIEASLKYQLYLVNGFSSYNGNVNLNGKNGFRKGRQKGAESFISSPNITGKIEYYGIRRLNIGVSGYFGNTQSTLYNGMDKNDMQAKSRADSSVVGMSMLGVDARYRLNGLQLRGQFYYTSITNSEQYNAFTSVDSVSNDLGRSMMGYYFELGYDLFSLFSGIKSELIPFIRYERYNTHQSVDEITEANKAYNNTIITTGFGWKITPGSVVKTDIQFIKSEADNKYSMLYNAGIGIMF